VADEEWKPVRGHRGYEASSLGRCRSVPRKLRDGRTAGGVVLVPWLDKDGYQVVQLGRRKVPVHVAVALAWHGPPEVRHLNGDEGDNKPGNLAWGSRRENERDKRKGREGRDRSGMEGVVSRPRELVTSPVSPVTDAR
jgi:hypothetical protein